MLVLGRRNGTFCAMLCVLWQWHGLSLCQWQASAQSWSHTSHCTWASHNPARVLFLPRSGIFTRGTRSLVDSARYRCDLCMLHEHGPAPPFVSPLFHPRQLVDLEPFRLGHSLTFD